MINIGYLFYKEYFSSLKIDKSSGVATFDGKRSLDKLKSLTLKEYKNYTNYLTGEYADKNKIINLTTTYPGLLIGSGYIHEIGGKEKKEKEYLVKNELKLGFYFDHTTGLPVIPASSVKGLLRSAFEKAKGEYVKELLKEELKIKNTDSINVTDLEKSIFEGEKNQSIYQRDIFFDAFPIGKINDGNFLANDYITPHDKPLKNPKPIQFLKVLPNVQFQFNFKLNDFKDENGNTISAEIKKELFKQILKDLGIGAKTNVGYGQFTDKDPIPLEGNTNQQNNSYDDYVETTQVPSTRSVVEEYTITNNEDLIVNQTYDGEIIEQKGDYFIFKVGNNKYVKSINNITKKSDSDAEKRMKRKKLAELPKYKTLQEGDKVKVIIKKENTFTVVTQWL